VKVVLVEPYGDRMGHFGFYASHLAQELARLGHQVVLVSGTTLPAEQFLRSRPLFRVVAADGHRSAGLGSTGGSKKWLRMLLHGQAVIRENWKTVQRALQLCRGESFDVIHFLDGEVVSTSILVTWHAVVRGQVLPALILHINPADFTFAAHRHNPVRGLYKSAARLFLRSFVRRSCAAVTVQGEWHRKRIRAQLGLRAFELPPFHVVRPGTLLPEQVLSPLEARRRLQLPAEAVVFLFFGMLRKEKGIDVLLEAVGGVPGNWYLLIAGAPFDWTRNILEERIARHGQTERVRVDARYLSQEEVGTCLAAADAVVLPYHAQGHAGGYGPFAVACGYGKPLVVTEVGEMGRLVKRHGLGLVVPPGDAAELGRALQQFVQCPTAIKREMGARARAFGDRCSFAALARDLSAIYIASKRKLPAPLLREAILDVR